MSTNRLAQFIKGEIKKETRDKKATGRSNKAKRLADLWKLVLEKEKAGTLVTQRLSLGHCCIPNEDERGFAIDAIGTSPAQAARFERLLKHSFNNSSHFNLGLNHRSPNLCSCGILISHGETRILLGGDIETGGWQDLVSQRSYLAERLNLVKVAHHGSPNGYCNNLWELHTAGVDRTYKVLTPYKHFNLPKKSTIDHLEKHGGHVYSAGDPYFDHQFVPTFVSTLTELKRKKETANNNPSRVSFTFDANGSLLDHSYDGEALQIC